MLFALGSATCFVGAAEAAPLPDGTLLTIKPGTAFSVGSGSYFMMAGSNGALLEPGSGGGLVVGGTTSNGRGTPQTTAVTKQWSYFGAAGYNRIETGNLGTGAPATNPTAPSDNGDGTFNMGGWTVNWNNGDVDMSAGAAATFNCQSGAGNCQDGDTYTLDYSAVVPSGSFKGVGYALHLEGTIQFPNTGGGDNGGSGPVELPAGTILLIHDGSGFAPGAGSYFQVDGKPGAALSAGYGTGLVLGMTVENGAGVPTSERVVDRWQFAQPTGIPMPAVPELPEIPGLPLPSIGQLLQFLGELGLLPTVPKLPEIPGLPQDGFNRIETGLLSNGTSPANGTAPSYNGDGTINMGGWVMNLGGADTDLSNGGPAILKCGACRNGDSYTLDYQATYPDLLGTTHQYALHLEGTLSIPDTGGGDNGGGDNGGGDNGGGDNGGGDNGGGDNGGGDNGGGDNGGGDTGGGDNGGGDNGGGDTGGSGTPVLMIQAGARSAGNSGAPDIGSYFGMEVQSGMWIYVMLEPGPAGGITLGTTQSASGSHSGAPNGSEQAGLDAPWQFFGNTGLHFTDSPVTRLQDNGSSWQLDFSGWSVTWNGIPKINMGSGAHGTNPSGVALVTCDPNCGVGNGYTLEYTARVPAGDPSGFGGVAYMLHIEGAIGEIGGGDNGGGDNGGGDNGGGDNGGGDNGGGDNGGGDNGGGDNGGGDNGGGDNGGGDNGGGAGGSGTPILLIQEGSRTSGDGGVQPDVGSYFGMEVQSGMWIYVMLKPSPVGGIILGTTQPASGSHSGPPNGSEHTGLDAAWQFFGNTGLHFTDSPVTRLQDNGSNWQLDFSGWSVTWNGIPKINMGSGTHGANPSGVALVTCDPACSVGNRYALEYTATVPSGDPSGFGGVSYLLHLEGEIGEIGGAITTDGDGTLTAGNMARAYGLGMRMSANDMFGTGNAQRDTAMAAECVGGCFDFRITGKSNPTANVVLALTDAIPANAVYRKYANGAWRDFDTSTGDQLASAPVANGQCPEWNDASFRDGLNPGDMCVRLTIADNGPNDDDPEAGTVADPSGVAATEAAPAFTDNRTASTSGCSLTTAPVNPLERADWFLLVGFIGWLGWLSRRRQLPIEG